MMRSIADFFNKPGFSRGNDSTESKKVPDELAPESSPLTEPSSSMISNVSPESEQEAEAQLNRALYLSTQESSSQPPTWPNFQGTESAAVLSLSESFGGSQRIIKDGKEVVISSDGEDTDSICSLDDPASLFAPITNKPVSIPSTVETNTAFRKIKSPKKYKHTIDSLVHDAVDDNEIEASVARVKANFTQNTPVVNDGTSSVKKGLNERVLTSALGDDNNDSIGLQRLLDAVRRTEALDHDRAWRFFNETQKLPSAPEFPRQLFTGDTSLDEFLADPEARERLFTAGDFLQLILSKGMLTDELIMWTFRSSSSHILQSLRAKLTILLVPYERRAEMSNAYYRILKVCRSSILNCLKWTNQNCQGVNVDLLRLLIRPADIDDLFTRLGAKPQSLDPSVAITPISLQGSLALLPALFIPLMLTIETTPDSRLKDNFVLISTLTLLREIIDL
jgi:hypothetical protein